MREYYDISVVSTFSKSLVWVSSHSLMSTTFELEINRKFYHPQHGVCKNARCIDKSRSAELPEAINVTGMRKSSCLFSYSSLGITAAILLRIISSILGNIPKRVHTRLKF